MSKTPAVMTQDSGNSSIALSPAVQGKWFSSVNDLGTATLNECLGLKRMNMKEVYDAANYEGGWSDQRALDGLHEDESRFLVLYGSNHGLEKSSAEHFLENSQRDEAANCSEKCPASMLPGSIVGYVQFLVEEDENDGELIVYLYELQLHKSFQGQGLGRAVVELLVKLAREKSARRIVLTVQRTNEGGREFWQKMQFEIDESSPDPDEGLGYEILSRPVTKTNRSRAKAKARKAKHLQKPQ